MTGTTAAPTEGADVVQAETLYSTRQRGRFTVAEVAGIDARVRYAELSWWRRWRKPRPPSWEQTRQTSAGWRT